MHDPVTISLAIELLHLRQTIKDFFVVFIAQKAKDQVPKLVTSIIQPATHCLVNQAVESLSLVLDLLCRVLQSVTPTFPALHIFLKSDNGRLA